MGEYDYYLVQVAGNYYLASSGIFLCLTMFISDAIPYSSEQQAREEVSKLSRDHELDFRVVGIKTVAEEL